MFFDVCCCSLPMYDRCIFCKDKNNLENHIIYIGNDIYLEDKICHDCFYLHEHKQIMILKKNYMFMFI